MASSPQLFALIDLSLDIYITFLVSGTYLLTNSFHPTTQIESFKNKHKLFT